MQHTLDAALRYREKFNFGVIPIGGDKRPLLKWTEYQKRKADPKEIREWWKKSPAAMIGVVTGSISKLLVIDCDTLEGFEAIQKLIPDTLVVPIARTPRGGWHLYFCFPENSGFTVGSGILPGVDFRGEGGYIISPPSRNEEGKAYTWMPGLSLDEAPPAALPDSIFNLFKKYLYIGHDDKDPKTMSSNVVMYQKGTRDDDLFHAANCLVKGGMQKNEIEQTLTLLALSCKPPFPLNEIPAKIQSAIQRAERRERNLTDEVREWVLSSSGVFLSSNVVNCLHLSSRDEQKHLSTILKRLCAEGLIEKYGNKNGQFRTLDKDEELIAWQNADITPLGIKFPLGVHEFVQVHKGNTVVIAGESNAGKTAYCLNLARMNAGLMPVNYMSSEMQDGAELAIRLKEFDVPESVWEPIKFTFRTDNFPDRIKPDALNIVDYLDEGTDAEAYKMPLRIRHIADKLKSGIAVVAIQKDPNKRFGLGGSGTMNRARVYLTIQRSGVLTIEKAKIWRDKNDNPNGKFIQFKLAAGCRFTNTKPWQNPESKN